MKGMLYHWAIQSKNNMSSTFNLFEVPKFPYVRIHERKDIVKKTTRHHIIQNNFDIEENLDSRILR